MVVGVADDESTPEMMQVISGTYLPNKIVAALDPNDPTDSAELKLFKGRTMINGQAIVYVCEGYSRREPVTNLDSLRSQLQGPNVHS